MNISKAKAHHAKVGLALERGDAATAMHHVGHMMAALKHGSPKAATTNQPDPAQPGPQDTSVAPATATPGSFGPSLRSRLAGMKGPKNPLASQTPGL